MAVSPEKARKILRHGTVGGKPLTPAQKRYFGLIAGGETPRDAAGGAVVAKKKWIQSAIKRPGRLRRMLGKKEGEPISQSELEQLATRARERGDRSLASAVALARRLKAMHRAQEGAVVGDPYVLIQLGYLEQGIGKPS